MILSNGFLLIQKTIIFHNYQPSLSLMLNFNINSLELRLTVNYYLLIGCNLPITYHPYRDSICSRNALCFAVLDCFNGEIITLEMRDNMKKDLCIDTVKQLRQKYGRLDGTVLHNGRGYQSTSYAFRRELVANVLIQSIVPPNLKGSLLNIPTGSYSGAILAPAYTISSDTSSATTVSKESTASIQTVSHLWR